MPTQIKEYTIPLMSWPDMSVKYQQSCCGPHTKFKARPIKHWRKQLMPNGSTCTKQQIATVNTQNCCNPDTKITRSASTVVNKYYYTDSLSYLRARCSTYDQKLSAASSSNNESTCCYTKGQKDNLGNMITITCNSVYKPIGAKSSGSRIEQLKYDTLHPYNRCDSPGDCTNKINKNTQCNKPIYRRNGTRISCN